MKNNTSQNPSELELSFMQQLQKVLLQQIKNGEHHWSLERIATALHLTEKTLQRKIKSHTQLTANQYLQEFRLRYGHQALKRKKYATTKEVAYACGYSNPSYFAKIFKQRFSYSPHTLLLKLKNSKKNNHVTKK